MVFWIIFVLMASIFVVLSKEKKSGLSEIAKKAMSRMSDSKVFSSNTLVVGKLVLGYLYDISTSTASKEKLPYFDPLSSCYITADARIDYREELALKLGIDWSKAKDYADSHFILLAYKKWGEACVEYLYGDFAFALWDDSQELLFCARDHFGCRRFYYLDHPEYLVISSDISGFEAIPGFRFQILEQSLCDAICSIELPKSETPFKSIRRLEPANCLEYSESRGITLRQYWDLEINASLNSINEEEALNELRKCILNAISQRSIGIPSIGVELSGGLDSSGILTGLANLINIDTQITAFTHSRTDTCLPGKQFLKSELEYCQYLLEKYDFVEHCIVTEKDQQGGYTALISFLDASLQPANQIYALFSDLLIENIERKGIWKILSGFGGDEGITYNGDGYYEELVIKRRYRKLYEQLRQRKERLGGRLYWQMAKVIIRTYVPSIFRLFQSDWRKEQYEVFAIDKVLAKRFEMQKRFFQRSFLPGIPDLKKRQYNRVMLSALTQRLENTAFLAGRKGIVYSYPFLDIKLMELFYSLPSDFKYKDGIGRYLYRCAMKGLLPEKIRLRNDKAGVTIPNALCRILKDAEKFREVILEGMENNQFHYVDYEKMLWMIEQLETANEGAKRIVSLRAFLGPVSVLILQKWQREGKIDIGIKC